MVGLGARAVRAWHPSGRTELCPGSCRGSNRWAPFFLRSTLLLLLAAALSACTVGPDYHRPSAPTSPAYKEALGWTPVAPSDAADRSDWWRVFDDPVLDDLEQQVLVSNQNLKAAEAGYRAAEALVGAQRAALFPTLGLAGSASKSGGSGTAGSTDFQIGAVASWAPDIWGGIRRSIEANRDNAQASAADLANAALSAQISLALDYIALRQIDEQSRLQSATVTAYRQTLRITQNRYDAGGAARSDVLSAQTQLASAEAAATDLAQQRASLEHAIAILIGRPPAAVTIAPVAWSVQTPEVPAGLPSALLQRRPDIAGAERRAAAASAQIGVAVAAFFPNVTLSGQGGGTTGSLGGLLSSATSFWSVGAAVAETIFDGGARSARVRQNRATYDQAVAVYRQTVLTAFGQVEDAMAAQRVLTVEQGQRDAASAAAARNERISLNEYQAGQVDYSSVVLAQIAALGARTAVLQNEASHMAAIVSLIGALGGGWHAEIGFAAVQPLAPHAGNNQP